MNDLRTVKSHLKDLTPQNLTDLGVELGLHYPRLLEMKNLRLELAAAWLNEEDDVLDSTGPACWSSLIAALRANGHKGIADKIEKGKQCRLAMYRLW